MDFKIYGEFARPQSNRWPKQLITGRQAPHARSAKLHGRRRHVMLHTRRVMHGMTQERLAAKAGVTRKTIHDIEQQKSTPSVYVALAIAEALGLDVAGVFRLS